MHDISTGKIARQKAEMIAEGIPSFILIEGSNVDLEVCDKFYRNYHICMSEGFLVTICLIFLKYEYEVYRTSNIEETFALIRNLPKIAHMKKIDYFKMYNQPNFVADVNSCKKVYDTPELNFRAFLLRVPGFGTKLSTSVARTFGSVKGMFDAYYDCQATVKVHVPGEQFIRSYNFKGLTEKGIKSLCQRFNF